jgi:hypothetical protein
MTAHGLKPWAAFYARDWRAGQHFELWADKN